MRHRTNEIGTGRNPVADADVHLAVDRQVNLGKLRKANVGAALALTDAFAQLLETRSANTGL